MTRNKLTTVILSFFALLFIAFLCSEPVFADTPSGWPDNYTGLYKYTDGNYYYIVDGELLDATGLKKDTDGTYYYIVRGVWQNTTTCIYTNSLGSRYYIKNGIKSTTFTGLLIDADGRYYYFERGTFRGDKTFIYTNTSGVQLYIKDGIHTLSTGLIKIDGEYYYIVKGKWKSGARIIYTNSSGKRYHIKEGKWNRATCFASFDSKYYLFENGINSETLDCIFHYDFNDKYYLIRSGIWDRDTGIIDIDGAERYIVNGLWQKTVNILYDDGSGKRWMIKDGIRDTGFKGAFTADSGTTYYILDGYFRPTYSGIASNSDGSAYYYEKGIWQSNRTFLWGTSKLAVINGVWDKTYAGVIKNDTDNLGYYVTGGKFKALSGLHKSSDGNYYLCVNGVCDYKTEKLYKNSAGKYLYIKMSRFRREFTGKYTNKALNKTYYIKNGFWASDFNGKLKDPADGLYYLFTGGVWRDTFIGIKQGSDGKYYYIVDGVWQAGFSGMYYSQNGYAYRILRGVYTGKREPAGAFALEMIGKGFPQSYIPYLKALHDKYPEWEFEPNITGLSWTTAVNQQYMFKYDNNSENIHINYLPSPWYGTKAVSLVAVSSPASWKSSEVRLSNGQYATGFDGDYWTIASKDIIRYYMDPRNFMDPDGRRVFQFLDLHYDSSQTAAVVKQGATSIEDFYIDRDELNSRWLSSNSYTHANGNTVNYPKIIASAGANAGVNPLSLVAMINQELGVNGASKPIISGLEGYPDGNAYYNYFNIGAYVDSKHDRAWKRGLWVASINSSDYMMRPWTTRAKAMNGGAAYFYNRYIKVGQETLYEKRFNEVRNQFSTAINSAADEGWFLGLVYSEELRTTTKLTFLIPVYEGMPDTACAKPQ